MGEPQQVSGARLRQLGAAVAKPFSIAWSHVPGTDASAHRTAAIHAAATAVAVREVAIKPRENSDQKTGQQNVDQVSQKQTDTAERPKYDIDQVTADIVNAVRMRYSKASSTQEMGIRQAVSNDAFIIAVENSAIPTPLEDVDDRYTKEAAKARKNLAGKLRALAAGGTEFRPTILEMEIIYVTLLGKSAVWNNWQTENETPKPPEAFMRFLESIAQIKCPGREGEFIGAILRELVTKKTITEVPEKGAQKPIADPEYVANYINGNSERVMASVMDTFTNMAWSLIDLPTADMHAELNVPGIGYEKWEDTEIRKMASALQQQIDVAYQAHMAPFERAVQQAQERFDQLADGDEKTVAESTLKRAQEARDAARVEGEASVQPLIAKLKSELNDRAASMARERVKKQIADTFGRAFQAWCEKNDDISKLADIMAPMLKNVTITELLSRIREVSNYRSETFGDLISASVVEEQQTAFRQVEKNLPDLEARISKLREEINSTELPEAVAREITSLVEMLADLRARRDITREIDEVEQKYAYPLRKVVIHALRHLGNERGEGRVAVGLAPKQWIIAKKMLESKDMVEATTVPGETNADRFKRWLIWHAFTPEAHAKKLSWWYGKTMYGPVEDIRAGREKVKGKKPDGTPYDTWIPRWMTGAIKLPFSFTFYVMGIAAAAYIFTAPVGFPIFSPKPFKEVSQLWTWPVTDLRKDTRIFIDDSYDDPSKLAGRGSEYYKQTYGLGHRIKGEKTDAEAQARLGWVQKHPEILVFMQERTTGRANVKITRINQSGDSCQEKASAPLPRTCSPLGINTHHDAEQYSPRGNSHAQTSAPVCCIIEVKSTPLSDGLMINPYKADEMVAYLMAAEGKMANQSGNGRATGTIVYSDLNSHLKPELVKRDFLIPAQTLQIMRQYGITKTEHAEMLLVQIEAGIITSMFNRGDAPSFVKPEYRDAYLELVRAKVIAGKRLDPSTRLTVKGEFAAAVNDSHQQAWKNGWVEDVSVEYRRIKMERKFHILKLKTETAKDVLYAQNDIYELVDRLSAWIKPERSDEFVQRLEEYKRSGGSISDFDPKATPPGKMVRWAEVNGLLFSSKIEGDGKTVLPATPDSVEAAKGSTIANAEVEPAKPILSPEAAEFYGKNPEFDSEIELIVRNSYVNPTSEIGRKATEIYGDDVSSAVIRAKEIIYKETKGLDLSPQDRKKRIFEILRTKAWGIEKAPEQKME